MRLLRMSLAVIAAGVLATGLLAGSASADGAMTI
jgi:hypothetical protein